MARQPRKKGPVEVDALRHAAAKRRNIPTAELETVMPAYGIKFNSNFQWSTTSRDVKDGSKDHITREPEQVRAFRDTWRDGCGTAETTKI